MNGLSFDDDPLEEENRIDILDMPLRNVLIVSTNCVSWQVAFRIGVSSVSRNREILLGCNIKLVESSRGIDGTFHRSIKLGF